MKSPGRFLIRFAPAVIALLLGGHCITWYHPLPEPKLAKSTQLAGALAYTLEFVVHPLSIMEQNPGSKEHAGVRAGLEASGLFNAYLLTKGRLQYQRSENPVRFFLEINTLYTAIATGREKTTLQNQWFIWTNILWGILPAYVSNEIDIECTIYIRDARGVYRTVKHRSYEIQQRTVSFILLVPFLWYNLLTPDIEDVYSQVTQDCVRGMF